LDKIVEKILSNFANNLRELIKDNFIIREQLESTNFNKLNQTHSILWCALSNSVCLSVEKNNFVAINHSLKPENNKSRFSPDVSVWKDNNLKAIVGVVDYESTNSSDGRVIYRDFENYRHSVQDRSFNSLKFWVIITTLPSTKVCKSADWFSWDLRRKDRSKTEYNISKTEYLKILENPFEYWFPKFSDEFDKLQEERKKCPLYVANLDFVELRLCLPRDEVFSAQFNA
jgi:hypothetical protein